MSHPEPSQPVFLAKSSDLQPSGGQTEGMVRSNAIVDKCDGICATSMHAKPHTASAVHHHGAQDTIVYAAQGTGCIVSEGGKKRVELQQGDYLLIPAYMEHQEVNDSDSDIIWTIVRSGRIPEVVNLTDWNGEPVKS
ncbi:hypothetical protein M426DRAFT_324503 [Hypoxylon sp. CI-4A]|nr:hypothetical protein M426DRAFT_324503 [Hypoxylon sp. CI-4A]